jgi:hypothetical protein
MKKHPIYLKGSGEHRAHIKKMKRKNTFKAVRLSAILLAALASALVPDIRENILQVLLQLVP